MDAELAPPEAVALLKLMGSEGLGGSGGAAAARGGIGVKVMEVDSLTAVGPSVDRCRSLLGHKDLVGIISTSELTFWNQIPDTELLRCDNKLASFDADGELMFGSRNSSSLSLLSLESKQLKRKSPKVARGGIGCSKRSRMAQMIKVSVDEANADDTKEKIQPAKQRNGLNGKRGDKRNGRVPVKSKYDYFSLKAGIVSFNSAPGGNNFNDTYDVTKHMDDLSVNELLDGSYKGPSFAKDKGKKAANLNENVLHSVRKACCILPLHKLVQIQNSTQIDSSCYRNISPCAVSSDASVASRNDGDKGDTCTIKLSSHEKVQDFSGKPQTPANVLDFPLCQPKTILERLALPAPKDLDSLLLDAAKPAVFSKSNSDSRGMQIPHQASLPPFPWSHNSGGNCKSNPDAIKLSSSRTTCPGRWVKIGNTASSLEGRTDFVEGLDSLTYDPSLVPLGALKFGPPENGSGPSTSVRYPWYELCSSSPAACSISTQLPPESGSSLKCEGDALPSPRSLVAARTLFDIATCSLKQELHGMVRWPKKPSEKTMKACKSKSKDKPGEIFAAPKPVFLTDDKVKNVNGMVPLPSKKPRLLTNEIVETSKDLGHQTARRGLINWSMPRSSRPSSSESCRDSFAETTCHNVKTVKPSWMMPPPPSRVIDKTGNSPQRLRKLVPAEWTKARGKLD